MNYISEKLGEPGVESVQTICLDLFCKNYEIKRIDLLKIDIQGHEYSALKGAERLLREGRIGFIFMELNWAVNAGAVCPASESIRLLEVAGYQFSVPKKKMDWKKSGGWMRTLSDVVARRVDGEQVL